MKAPIIMLILLVAVSMPALADTPAAATETPSTAAPNFNLEWYSFNSGGDVDAASTNFRLGLSVGQAAAGAVSGTDYNLSLGFWAAFGAAPTACPVVMTGDVDMTGAITASDIIYVVNYVFKGGVDPLPCAAAADVNCSGAVNSSDIIYMVNHVFKGGAEPCDVCTMIPGTWTCP